jgi:hypothetical protein
MAVSGAALRAYPTVVRSILLALADQPVSVGIE